MQEQYKLIKAYNDLDLPDSLLPVFYNHLEEDCYVEKYQTIIIPDSREGIKSSQSALLFFWLLENGADYGDSVVILYNNPDWRKKNLNGLFYEPSEMDAERKELYAFIENTVGYCTGADRAIKQKLDQFFQKQDNQKVDIQKIISNLKAIAVDAINSTGKDGLDSALRLYFEKKSVFDIADHNIH